MLSQLKAILIVKALMLRHRFTRGKGIPVVVNILIGFFIAVVSIGVFAATFVLGRFALTPPMPPGLLMLLLDAMTIGFLFVWATATISELERFDALDIRRMLYLPVSLPVCFTLNLAMSLVSFLGALFLAAATGFFLGLATHTGPLPALISILLATVFFITLGVWTYLFRTLLASWLENKRKRRAVLSMLGIGFVILMQIPALFNFAMMGEGGKNTFVASLVRDAEMTTLVDSLRLANVVVPFGWFAFGAESAMNGEYGIALVCVVGMLGIAWLGATICYRSLVQHYMGVGVGRAIARAKTLKQVIPTSVRRIANFRLPFAAEETSTLAYTNLLMLARAPFLRFLVVSWIFLFILVLFMTLSRRDIMEKNIPEFAASVGGYALTGLISIINLNGSLLYMNVFGMDQDGFRALVLLPTLRRRYLLAKNLSVLALMAPFVLTFIALALALGITTPLAAAMALVFFLQQWLLFSALGQWMSIYYPIRMRNDAMKPMARKNASFMGSLLMFVCLPVILGPTAVVSLLDMVFASTLNLPRHLFGTLGAFFMVAIASVLYVTLLPHAANALMGREEKILDALRKDKE